MTIWIATGNVLIKNTAYSHSHCYYISADTEKEAKLNLVQQVIGGSQFGVLSFEMKEIRVMSDQEIIEAIKSTY